MHRPFLARMRGVEGGPPSVEGRQVLATSVTGPSSLLTSVHVIVAATGWRAVEFIAKLFQANIDVFLDRLQALRGDNLSGKPFSYRVYRRRDYQRLHI